MVGTSTLMLGEMKGRTPCHLWVQTRESYQEGPHRELYPDRIIAAIAMGGNLCMAGEGVWLSRIS